MRRYILVFALIASLSVVAAPKKKKQQQSDASAIPEIIANAERSFLVYDFDAATEAVDKWEEIVNRLNKDDAPVSQMRDRIIMARNMLERVEKIEFVDTLHVEADDFFKYYRLSPEAGSLVSADILPTEFVDSIMPKVVYIPQDRREIFWGKPSGEGTATLAVSDVLDDGTVTAPRLFGSELNVGSTDYPFMMQDGVTIYYGATGEGSLGGYDIFMTRRGDDGEMLQPQNIGMPYNSPHNDYMMVIDETADLGWWASDREGIPGKVTIYVFVPSKMRVNHDSNSDDITSLALLDSISITGDLDARIVDATGGPRQDYEFFFPLGNGQVYTSLAQFRNPQARQAMKNLLKRISDSEATEAQLADLRARYAAGDKTVASEILRLEKVLKDSDNTIKRNTNQVINLEQK